MSVNEFRDHILDSLLQVLWRHWSSLGIYTGVEKEQAFVIDPEALMCATLCFGRYDQRLFDEMLSWLCKNADMINIARLKNVVNSFEFGNLNILGAISGYLSKKEKKRKWESLARFCTKKSQEKEETLFYTKDFQPMPVLGKEDELFQKWNLSRNEVVLRHLAENLNVELPANIVFRMRSFLGVGTRADICAYLLFSKGDNSLQIAKVTNFSQRSVYQTLNELHRSAFVKKRILGREAIYSLDQTRWTNFLEIKTNKLEYLNWTQIFSAFSGLFRQLVQTPEKFTDSYLASSNLRMISGDYVSKIEKAGIQATQMKLYQYVGEAFTEYFIEYVEGIISRILSPESVVTFT
ncbi:hypothetical protein HKBW3S42_00604 [Candidatus Hakubella thermalkaliphila]|uniref:Uncharacterized protein n=1 Tax=Candidatus Hakubella thermalkaliphila TaxID=2754717 RepID=A0A6V8PJ56_9ACTN|nr:hypothetical protein HKBW3S42_00604 [Candidatus Hakubella thermalkaliphila]GFP42286.1 hypothetical protein HKBW3C_01412 [Candidatus Hakubella thermalkaliphila]